MVKGKSESSRKDTPVLKKGKIFSLVPLPLLLEVYRFLPNTHVRSKLAPCPGRPETSSLETLATQSEKKGDYPVYCVQVNCVPFKVQNNSPRQMENLMDQMDA